MELEEWSSMNRILNGVGGLELEESNFKWSWRIGVGGIEFYMELEELNFKWSWRSGVGGIEF